MTIHRLAFAFALLVALLTTPIVNGQRTRRALWPKQSGVFVATSSETIPLFPRGLSGYRPVRKGFSYFDEPFEWSGSIRVGYDWSGIPGFPAGMNHCDYGVWMLRWRNSNSDVLVASRASSYDDVDKSYPFAGNAVRVGRFGYIHGFSCVQPAFKISRTLNRNSSTIDDIYYELKFWQAAP
jgi:hypothetical protein